MQQYAEYLFTAKLLYMFRVSIAPIIRSTQNCTCSFWYRSQYLTNNLPLTLPKQATLEEGCCTDTCYDLHQKLQVQFYLLLMMGAMYTRNMQSNIALNKYLHTVASCWILLIQSYDARNREYKIQWPFPVSFRPRNGVQLPAGSRHFSIVNSIQTNSEAYLGHPIQCILVAPSSEVKQLVMKLIGLPSSAKIQNALSYCSNLPYVFIVWCNNLPPWPNQGTLEEGCYSDTMTCTRSCNYSFM